MRIIDWSSTCALPIWQRPVVRIGAKETVFDAVPSLAGELQPLDRLSFDPDHPRGAMHGARGPRDVHPCHRVARTAVDQTRLPRSEERSVGTEGVSTCRWRWSPEDPKKKKEGED